MTVVPASGHPTGSLAGIGTLTLEAEFDFGSVLRGGSRVFDGRGVDRGGVLGAQSVAVSWWCSMATRREAKQFQSALDSGATCKDLFDERARLHDEGIMAKVDRDLARIGCASPESKRNDG